MPATSTPSPTHLIDPRGPRFAAGVTATLLAGALVLGPTAGLPILIVQGAAFLIGAGFGVRYQPWGLAFRRLVRPFLAPPAELEDAGPPRFAQTVGLAFVIAALIAAWAGLPALFYTVTGLAFGAALLNAVFDFCLGCELYVLGVRLLGGSAPSANRAAAK